MSDYSFGDSPPPDRWRWSYADIASFEASDKYDYSDSEDVDYDCDQDDGDSDFNADKDDYSEDDCGDDDYICDRDDDDIDYATCKVCNKLIPSIYLDEHLNNRHKCNYCSDCDFMNAESIDAHVKEKHMVSCKHCNIKQLISELAQHELSHPVVGMIQMNQLPDERFNQLVAANRIYAMDGKLYIKEQECEVLSEQVSNIEIK